MVGEIASKVPLIDIQLGPKFFLSLESADQVKKDLFSSEVTGDKARYTIGKRNIIPAIAAVDKILGGDFKLSNEEESSFLICVAANKAFQEKFKSVDDVSIFLIKNNEPGLYLLPLWENTNVRASYARADWHQYGRNVFKYSSGGSHVEKGFLISVKLETAFDAWLAHRFKK